MSQPQQSFVTDSEQLQYLDRLTGGTSWYFVSKTGADNLQKDLLSSWKLAEPQEKVPRASLKETLVGNVEKIIRT